MNVIVIITSNTIDLGPSMPCKTRLSTCVCVCVCAIYFSASRQRRY